MEKPLFSIIIPTYIKFNFNLKHLVFYPLSKHTGFRGLYLVFLMLFWQLTNASGFVFELINQKLQVPKLHIEKQI